MRRITCLLALPAGLALVAMTNYHATSTVRPARPDKAVLSDRAVLSKEVKAVAAYPATSHLTKQGADASLVAAFHKAQYRVEPVSAPARGRGPRLIRFQGERRHAGQQRGDSEHHCYGNQR